MSNEDQERQHRHPPDARGPSRIATDPSSSGLLPVTLQAFLLALAFLTRWPVPTSLSTNNKALALAPLFYPLVGLLLGLSLWLMTWALQGLQPPLAAALLLLFWVWSTGALHLDGLADCADAWVGGLVGRERALEILKDPRSGPIAVVVLVLTLLLKLTALWVLFDLLQRNAAPTEFPTDLSSAVSAQAEQRAVLPWLLIATPMLARAQILALASTTDYVRPGGLGSLMSREMPRAGAWTVLGLSWLGFLVLGLMLGQFLFFLLITTAAWLCFWWWRRSALARLGGYTGDVAGALVELTELVLLLAALILINAL